MYKEHQYWEVCLSPRPVFRGWADEPPPTAAQPSNSDYEIPPWSRKPDVTAALV